MSLVDLVDNNRTDKNTLHSYLPLYDSLFSKKKDTATNILEVGIGPFKASNGGSIKLWRDYFTNARIFAIDILPLDQVYDLIKKDHRIQLYTNTNAYDMNFVHNTFINNNIKFDMVLDDGPHTIESMIQFVSLYSNLLKDDGILVIEDVQDFSWIEILTRTTPNHLKQFIEVYDLRANKGRYDDIVFVINKSRG
jgi:hypothetical protein